MNSRADWHPTLVYWVEDGKQIPTWIGPTIGKCASGLTAIRWNSETGISGGTESPVLRCPCILSLIRSTNSNTFARSWSECQTGSEKIGLPSRIASLRSRALMPRSKPVRWTLMASTSPARFFAGFVPYDCA
jgi:hypothetical protein